MHKRSFGRQMIRLECESGVILSLIVFVFEEGLTQFGHQYCVTIQLGRRASLNPEIPGLGTQRNGFSEWLFKMLP